MGLRRAITNVVRARLGQVPADIEKRLAGLDSDDLDRLNTELACAADEAAFRAVLERREG